MANALAKQSDCFNCTSRFYFEPKKLGRQNQIVSLSSMTVGDYQERFSENSTSYLAEPDFFCSRTGNMNHRELQDLILSWMNDPSDEDINIWPQIESELNAHRLKFPDNG